MEGSRRRVIKVGLGGAAILGMGGIGLSLRPTILREPATALKALDEKAFSILAAICDRIIPHGPRFPTARDVQLAEKVDTLLASLHPGDVSDIRDGLMLIENALAGLLFDGRWSSFTASPPEVQDVALNNLRTSMIPIRRTIYRAIYGMVSGAYWSSPETYDVAGYGGPPEFGSGLATKPSRPPVERRQIEPPGPLDKELPIEGNQP